ncbi:catalase family peroxidase [Silvibacterium dinghuense]|uniref:Catalase-related peroxidase n=1 Tax=Silvibacterium dinghuense TaxID=1560006 RepID=A0A4V1NV34_9BACT|nr:catalase family peroxidase [Silvibacterium dinghuense]RXS94372.1 catalase family peroxidase [Silvibacterium dinghuense]GGH16538.1 catalase-related peroxidase [Silvibacterium dinghuense]
MPLPNDEKLLALSNDLIQQFDQIFGLHPGFRPAHAKGILLTGTFAPAPGASALTRAPHITRPSTPVTVRFSNSTGLPLIPDNDPNANPRGLAIRFNLAEHVHTDIVSHTTDGFPTHTGAEFLEFLRAVVASDPKNLAGTPLEAFLGQHPETLAFIQTPKPAPESFATDHYFGVTAMEFFNAEGKSRFGRYRILPGAGVHHLSDEAVKAKSANYLIDEIGERVKQGPVTFKIVVQLANEGDVTDNATVHWPEDREIVDFGTITLDALVADEAKEQQHIIFDPIPRVDGIEPSADPLLELRAAVYLISGRRRRAAPPTGEAK